MSMRYDKQDTDTTIFKVLVLEFVKQILLNIQRPDLQLSFDTFCVKFHQVELFEKAFNVFSKFSKIFQ